MLGICLLLSGRNEQRKPGNELCASLSSLEEPGRSLTLVETAILVSRALVYYQMATKKIVIQVSFWIPEIVGEVSGFQSSRRTAPL